MKCQNLFSEKNKKNVSNCHLLKIFPRVLSIKILCGMAKSQDQSDLGLHSLHMLFVRNFGVQNFRTLTML